jgi:hypothetical protein
MSADLAAAELSLSTRTDVMYHSVQGPGSAASFLDPGAHVLHEVDLRKSRSIMDGHWDSVLSTTLRITDSLQFDPEKFSVQKFEWRLSNQEAQIHIGDHFANLSPYSLSKGIKGLAIQRNLGDEQNYIRALYGSFDGQWAFLYKDPVAEPMNRHGGGVRLQRVWAERFRLGINLAHVADQADDPLRPAGVDAFRQVMPAVDWEWREAGLVISGEHAYADTRRMPFGVDAVELDGVAHRVELRTSLGDLRLDGRVERVSPDFYSLGGGATRDRLRWHTRGEYRLNRDWRIFLTYDDWRDNLAGQRPATTENTTWEAGVRKARLFDRRHLNLSTSWRIRAVETSDARRNSVSDRIKIGLNDRIGPAFDWRAELEYILDDDRVAVSDADSYLFDVGLGWRQRFKDIWDMRANLDFGRQENETVRVTGRDISNRLRLSLSASREGGMTIGGFYEYGMADLIAATADNRYNRAGLFWQISPAWLKDGSLRFELSDFQYTFTQDASRDYREQIAKVSLRWDFEQLGLEGDSK